MPQTNRHPDPARVPKIAVFDSGVGGLSILTALEQGLPHAAYVYCSDNLNHPYGLKDEAAILGIVDATVKGLVDRFKPDILIIACNTASTVTLPSLRRRYTLPIVGVVPAIKPAAQLSRSKFIGLLATPATIRRGYTEQLINDFAGHCDVVKVGSSQLVSEAEKKMTGRPVDEPLIACELAPLFVDRRLDTVVLGCTHFPLLQTEFERLAPWPVMWLDSASAIVGRVRVICQDLGFSIAEVKAGPPREGSFVFTRDDGGTQDLVKQLGLVRRFTTYFI